MKIKTRDKDDPNDAFVTHELLPNGDLRIEAAFRHEGRRNFRYSTFTISASDAAKLIKRLSKGGTL